MKSLTSVINESLNESPFTPNVLHIGEVINAYKGKTLLTSYVVHDTKGGVANTDKGIKFELEYTDPNDIKPIDKNKYGAFTYGIAKSTKDADMLRDELRTILSAYPSSTIDKVFHILNI